MEVDLTLSSFAIEQLSAALRETPERIVRGWAGVSHRAGVSEFLVHRTALQPSSDEEAGAAIAVRGAARPNEIRLILRELSGEPLGRTDRIALVIGFGAASGCLAGLFVGHGGRVEPIRRIKVVSAGLPSMSVRTDGARRGELDDAQRDSESVWSRTIGALGAETWRRLTALKIAVVGCGRTGSLFVTSLARLGVKDITLVDPDFVEEHNVGEMCAVAVADIGQRKIDAMARKARSWDLPSAPSFTLVRYSVMSIAAAAAIKACDAIVSCVDNAQARFATDYLAKLYLKPLIDVGAGVLAATAEDRALGADVRLLLPERCLMCFGGIAGATPALGELTASGTSDGARETAPDWRAQRAGSLRSLNTAAVGLATRLLEDFISGRVQSSTWLRLEYESNGIPQLREGAALVTRACSICGVAGLGDSGLSRLRAVAQERLRRNSGSWEDSEAAFGVLRQ